MSGWGGPGNVYGWDPPHLLFSCTHAYMGMVKGLFQAGIAYMQKKGQSLSQRCWIYMYMNNHSKRCWRKARQQQHNRKAKQHNTTRPKQSFFKENWLPRVGLEPTTISSPGDALTCTCILGDTLKWPCVYVPPISGVVSLLGNTGVNGKITHTHTLTHVHTHVHAHTHTHTHTHTHVYVHTCNTQHTYTQH